MKWRDACIVLTLEGDKWEVGRGAMSQGVQVGEQSMIMGSVILFPCYVVLLAHKNLEIAIVSDDVREI